MAWRPSRSLDSSRFVTRHRRRGRGQTCKFASRRHECHLQGFTQPEGGNDSPRWTRRESTRALYYNCNRKFCGITESPFHPSTLCRVSRVSPVMGRRGISRSLSMESIPSLIVTHGQAHILGSRSCGRSSNQWTDCLPVGECATLPAPAASESCLQGRRVQVRGVTEVYGREPAMSNVSLGSSRHLPRPKTQLSTHRDDGARAYLTDV